MNRARAFLFSWFILLASTVYGQDVDVSMDIQPASVRLGENALLRLTLHGTSQGRAPNLPEIDGLRILYTSANSQFGTAGQSATFTYTITPRKTGTFTIGPYTIKLGGVDRTVDPVTLTVLEPGAKLPEDVAKPFKDRLRLEVTLSKETVFPQEFIELRLILYSQGVNLSDRQDLVEESFQGVKTGSWQSYQPTRVREGGKVWTVQEFRTQAQAVGSGTIMLAPALRVGVISDNTARPGFFGPSLFDSMMRDVQEVTVMAEPITLKVVPFPEQNRPSDFNGAVGKFTLQAEITPKEVIAGDPVTLRMMLTGTGNIEAAQAPELISSEGFREYETRISQSEIARNQTAGKKLYEKVLIPLSDTITEIPAVQFSYFDSEAGMYRTEKRGPFPIVVKPSAETTTPLFMSGNSRATGKVAGGRDILYIKEPTGESPFSGPVSRLATAPWFIALQGVPLAWIALCATLAWRTRTLAGNQALARRKKAPKVARASIHRAEKALAASNHAEYQAGLQDAVVAYFSNRYDVGPGQITPAFLREKVLPTSTGEEAARLLEEIEASRYSGASSNLAPNPNLLEQVNGILRALE